MHTEIVVFAAERDERGEFPISQIARMQKVMADAPPGSSAPQVYCVTNGGAALFLIDPLDMSTAAVASAIRALRPQAIAGLAEYDVGSAADEAASIGATTERPVPACRRQDGNLPAAKSRKWLAADLDTAIRRRALSVHYQPQFELATGRGCGVEALARWELPTGESIAPSAFIPVAERCGMIRALGAAVLEGACRALADWPGRGAQGWTLSVNISPLQIDDAFHEVLGGILERTGFPAESLELEITESMLFPNTSLPVRCMKRWKDLGVHIALDDFGIGYSSLSRLSQLPVDRLKIDTSLVRGMEPSGRSTAVVKSIIMLGVELGVDVIAEGVETEPQLKMLRDLGCQRAQGYLFGRPMPAQAAQLTLRKAWGERPLARVLPIKRQKGAVYAS